ncbi:DsbA family protein [Streptomyces melanogenes]|uniref:DsbA family protein n=1 Tax=Streptomyces melanogenes TaxID=67326 RepID=UPI00379F17E6
MLNSAARSARHRATLGALAVLLCAGAPACSSGSGEKAEPAPAVSTVGPTARAGEAMATLAKLPAKLGADGTSLVVGKDSAPHTVKVMEDPRCPYCAKFETAAGPKLAELAADGQIRIEYTIASFLDANLGGSGSANAARALRASLDAGKFPEYHAALYASQPKESVDGFTPAFLLAVADKVPGLRGAAFDKAVSSGAHADWSARAEKAFETSGARGTPTVLLDGKPVGPDDALYEAGAFTAALKERGIG